jgi:putative FmdB family regulatory protein
MPTYDYACPACGGFDAFRPLAQRNEPATCPDCGAASPRVFATAPRLALMDSGTRHAMATNERAQHAPKSSGDYARLRHPAGCGCCSPGAGKRSATLKAPNGNKAFPSKRPWMISH